MHETTYNSKSRQCQHDLHHDLSIPPAALLNWARTREIEAKDINAVLSFARVYGDWRWMNHDGIYDDDELETAVEKRVLQSKGYHCVN